jgi:hypothetical protein
MSKRDPNINIVKQHLGIKKDQLILLQVYKQYGEEFYETKDAVEFILDKIKEEK